MPRQLRDPLFRLHLRFEPSSRERQARCTKLYQFFEVLHNGMTGGTEQLRSQQTFQSFTVLSLDPETSSAVAAAKTMGVVSRMRIFGAVADAPCCARCKDLRSQSRSHFEASLSSRPPAGQTIAPFFLGLIGHPGKMNRDTAR